MATITEFTIIQGKALDFMITVKQNGTLTPLILNVADTFNFTLTNKKGTTKYITNKPMVITSAIGGQVSGEITAIESAALPVKQSYAEDGYMSRPSMRLIVSGSTVSQGDMTAIIEDVYVVVG